MKWIKLMGGIGLVVSVVGCDFGHAYEAKIEDSLETLQHAEVMTEYLKAAAWSGNDFGLSVRLPKGMTRLPEAQVDGDGNATSDPDPFLQPPVNLTVPNRIATFRTYIQVGVSSEQQRLPVFLYIAAVRATGDSSDPETLAPTAFREQIVEQFQKDFQGVEPKKVDIPNEQVHGVETKTYTLFEGDTTAEFISLRGQRDREVPVTTDAALELYLHEDEHQNQVALLFYWARETIQKEQRDADARLRRSINYCLETVEFASK